METAETTADSPSGAQSDDQKRPRWRPRVKDKNSLVFWVLLAGVFAAWMTGVVLFVRENNDPENQLAECATEAAVKIDRLRAARDQPDVEIVPVAWDSELWSYNQLQAIDCQSPYDQ